jgi:xanthine dehydrogenase molybdopterin binding subunit/xanthine dehydrogenase small subunit
MVAVATRDFLAILLKKTAMGDAIEFTLNGRLRQVEDESLNTPLLDYLRNQGLTGSKEGCAEGDCGACSVAIVDRDSRGKTSYRAINSCLVPICLMAGREIITVEGLKLQNSKSRDKARSGNAEAHGSERLHPVQQKMVECHGSQCGYCTPGFILSMFEGYYRDDLRTNDQLDDQLCGNLCRCTGYRPIRDAAIEAFQERHTRNGEDAFAQRLKQTAPKLEQVKCAFAGETFLRPTSLIELLETVAEHPEGRLIAGATELGLEISKRFKKFSTLISVEAVPELKEIKSTASEWHIGAAVTLTHIEEKMAAEFPALGGMLRVFGSRQIRNRATMGGNLVTASPIGDSAPVLLAMDAKVTLVSLADPVRDAKGETIAIACDERTIPISEFFLAYRKTALRPDEVLKTIIVPRFPAQRGGARKLEWYKVSKRREMDISTVAACFALDQDRDGTVRDIRLAYGGVAAMPARARKTEEALLGKPWTMETLAAVLPILETEFTPISDVRGAAEYRARLIKSLLQKFYEDTTCPKSQTRNKDRSLPASPSLGVHPLGCSAMDLIRADTLKGGHRASRFASSTRMSGRALPHESGHKHVTGEAVYADDHGEGVEMLEVWPVCSPHARAKILKRDAAAARAMPGIKAVLLAEDVPGLNDVGTKNDEVLLPDKEVSYHGQIVALVVGESPEACRAAADKVVVEYEPLTPILTLEQALERGSFHNEPNFIRRGNIADALKNSPMTLEGVFELGGQEHFYLETQAAWAEPGEDGSVFVTSSTQHPSEVQMVVAHMLHVPMNQVVVRCPRMGGGFGGKETQAALPAALAALAARHTGRAVRVRFNRDQDMAITGHRHPFRAEFKAGFDAQGLLKAAQIHLCSNGGWALDLSQAVTDRALFHLDNAYYIPAVEFRGQVAKTNLSSNTAFRGFGGPQGMLAIEEIIDRIARRLGLPPEVVRERNLYRGKSETNTTHYGQEIEDHRIQTIWKELKKSSELEKRRKAIADWNTEHANRKRGLAMTPVKFGISFTVTHLNQAGALVLLYQDGTVQVNHGATEMGQGVHTNMAAIAAKELGVKPENVRLMPTSTDKVPNTSATAASCGTDLNGAAVKNACEILRERLLPIAMQLLNENNGRTPKPANIEFTDGCVRDRKLPRKTIGLGAVLRKAYLERISLSATGYYCTPGIYWDRVAGRGKPFHYFAYGAAVTEIEVDGFTGMHQVLRTDILHDVGDSINEGINRGQIEGGFVQGMGWLTTEELKWDGQGRLLTHSPDTYKIPAVGDMPQVFNVTLLKNAPQKNVVYGTKAVGEPPLMLAISVREAIRDAVAAFGPQGSPVELASPATAEAIFMAIQKHGKSEPKTGRDRKIEAKSL